MSPIRQLATLVAIVSSLVAAPPARAADTGFGADTTRTAFAVDRLLQPSPAWIDDAPAGSRTFTFGAGGIGTPDVVDAAFDAGTFVFTEESSPADLGPGVTPLAGPHPNDGLFAQAPPPVPEPSNDALMAAGLLAIGYLARRRRDA